MLGQTAAVARDPISGSASNFRFSLVWPASPPPRCSMSACGGRFPVSHRLDDAGRDDHTGFDIAAARRAALSDRRPQQPVLRSLFLAPVMTSAVSLPLRRTLRSCLLALACATVLMFWIGLCAGARRPGARAAAALRHRLVGGASASARVFITIYGSRVAEEARQLAERPDGHRARAGPRAASFAARRPRRRGGP